MQRMVMVCVVRCGEVRRSEKVVRRKKKREKGKEKERKKEREREKKNEARDRRKKNIFLLSVLEQCF